MDLGALKAPFPGTHLPMLAALGLPAVGYIGYRWYRSRSATTAAQAALSPQSVSTVDPNSVPTDTSMSGLPAPSYTGGGGSSGVPVLGGAGTGLDLPQWAQAAEAYLIQHGSSPLDAVNAVNAYTTGQYLPANDQTLINTALGSLGPPPGAPGPVLTPPPSTYPSSVDAQPVATTPTPVVQAPTSYPTPQPSYSVLGTVGSAGNLQSINYGSYHGALYEMINGTPVHISSPYEYIPPGTPILGTG